MRNTPFFKILILCEQACACTYSMKGIETHLTHPKKKISTDQVAALLWLPPTHNQARLPDLHLPPHASPCECCVYLNVQSTMVLLLFLFSMPKITKANGEMKLGLETSKKGLA